MVIWQVEYDTIFVAKIRWKCERGGDFLDVANVLNNIELPVVYYREGQETIKSVL